MEQEILNTAFENLRNTAGIKARRVKNTPLDGTICLEIDNQEIQFVIEIKRELRQHQLQQIELYHKDNQNLLVIAENIFPKIKNQFRKLGIAYLEANGNIFIKTNQKFVFIDTNKKKAIRKEKSNRAFTKTGLKVLFQFLMNPKLINEPHRKIAKEANVGLGNIPLVIDGLKETGYLIALDGKNYVWNNKIDLLDRWINEYATELRPKTVIGRYKIPEQWKKLNLNNEITVWGGEPAADILTEYIRPEKLLLHTKENQINLIKNYRIIPDKEGDMEVLEMFWPKNKNETTAPPILVYAELMIQGGKRNEEVAKLIFNEFIEPNI